ncbi:hypothetical protein C0989_007980 [Termitomyces sp. Mn162]|nr:hypothetical protein C0989_007980 [Termitomyces sp. Mn162]
MSSQDTSVASTIVGTEIANLYGVIDKDNGSLTDADGGMQSESAGEEVSRIYYIGFKGDMRSPQREANSKLQVPAPNAADAPLVDKVAEKTAGQQTTAR